MAENNNLEMKSLYDGKINGGSLELVHKAEGTYKGKRGQETTKTTGSYVRPCKK